MLTEQQVKDFESELLPLTTRGYKKYGGLKSCQKLQRWISQAVGYPDLEVENQMRLLEVAFEQQLSDAYRSIAKRGYLPRSPDHADCMIAAAATLMHLGRRGALAGLLEFHKDKKGVYDQARKAEDNEKLSKLRASIWLGKSSIAHGYNWRKPCVTSFIQELDDRLQKPAERELLVQGLLVFQSRSTDGIARLPQGNLENLRFRRPLPDHADQEDNDFSEEAAEAVISAILPQSSRRDRLRLALSLGLQDKLVRRVCHAIAADGDALEIGSVCDALSFDPIAVIELTTGDHITSKYRDLISHLELNHPRSIEALELIAFSNYLSVELLMSYLTRAPYIRKQDLSSALINYRHSLDPLIKHGLVIDGGFHIVINPVTQAIIRSLLISRLGEIRSRLVPILNVDYKLLVEDDWGPFTLASRIACSSMINKFHLDTTSSKFGSPRPRLGGCELDLAIHGVVVRALVLEGFFASCRAVLGSHGSRRILPTPPPSCHSFQVEEWLWLADQAPFTRYGDMPEMLSPLPANDDNPLTNPITGRRVIVEKAEEFILNRSNPILFTAIGELNIDEYLPEWGAQFEREATQRMADLFSGFSWRKGLSVIEQ